MLLPVFGRTDAVLMYIIDDYEVLVSGTCTPRYVNARS